MKKFTFLLVVTICTLIDSNASAQIVTKGDIIGGINFSAQKFYNFDSTGNYTAEKRDLNFAPFISYGVKRNLTIGTYLLLNNSNGNNFSFSKYNHDYAIALFTRRYFPIKNSLYAFAQGDLRYTSIGKIYNHGKFVGSSVSLNLAGGIGYQVTKKLGLELGINNIFSVAYFKSRGFLNDGTFTNSRHNNFTWRNAAQRNGLQLGVTFKF